MVGPTAICGVALSLLRAPGTQAVAPQPICHVPAHCLHQGRLLSAGSRSLTVPVLSACFSSSETSSPAALPVVAWRGKVTILVPGSGRPLHGSDHALFVWACFHVYADMEGIC